MDFGVIQNLLPASTIFEIRTTDVSDEIATERGIVFRDERENVLLNWPSIFYPIEPDYQSHVNLQEWVNESNGDILISGRLAA